ncbi:hypothetical protein [Streptomyces sp. MBT62]|uniref:hypothetical protein n=1 Tax=Streptomyces sp. MBT62 TaxID=2800410 RepID=UPI001F2175B0|nr:hypothetical protein [Streptomyces sp. MBT62]
MAGQNANGTTVSGPVNGNPAEFRPVLDGRVKPWTYEQALAGGHLNDVPVLADGNKDQYGASPSPAVKLADCLATAQKEYGTLADEFLTLYPATTDTEAGQARNVSACNASAREGSRVSANLRAAEWSDYVANFATHGDPNGHGLTRRPVANRRLPIAMERGDHVGPLALADAAKVDFFGRFFASQKRW